MEITHILLVAAAVVGIVIVGLLAVIPTMIELPAHQHRGSTASLRHRRRPPRPPMNLVT
jgi:hypothetical protein